MLHHTISQIMPPSSFLQEKAQAHLDSLIKPQGSLGELERIATQLFCIQNAPTRIAGSPARMLTIAADHGVVEEGIASTHQAVSRQMATCIATGDAGVSVLCATAGADLLVVDVGIKGGPLPSHPRLRNEKIAQGTANIAKGPAMSREECIKALNLGISLAAETAQMGYHVIGTGEMGIGNTTPSTALFCAFLEFYPEEITGAGAGIPPKGLAHKIAVIKQALVANTNAVASRDPLTILTALGGFEIAVLAGIILGGAAHRLAIVIDGFIATAAYCVAFHFTPTVRDFCFFSHCSAETGHAKVLDKLKQKPFFDLGLRLGEGSGAALGFYLLKAAANIYNDMATFTQAKVSV